MSCRQIDGKYRIIPWILSKVLFDFFSGKFFGREEFGKDSNFFVRILPVFPETYIYSCGEGIVSLTNAPSNKKDALLTWVFEKKQKGVMSHWSSFLADSKNQDSSHWDLLVPPCSSPRSKVTAKIPPVKLAFTCGKKSLTWSILELTKYDQKINGPHP